MLHGEAEKLGGYSPELAAANARADMRELMAEIKRGNDIGGELAKFQEVSSRLSAHMYELWTRVEDWLLSLVTPVLEWLDKTLQMIREWITGEKDKPDAGMIDPFLDQLLGNLPNPVFAGNPGQRAAFGPAPFPLALGGGP